MTGRLFRIGIYFMTLMTSFSSNSFSESVKSDTLRVHFPKVKLILDPHRMEDAFSMATVLQLYRGLLRYKPEGDVAPDLAESWTESSDHLRYIFKIRAAQFSNGVKITVKTVQMSFARIFALGASMGADLDYISGVEEFRKTNDLSKLGIQLTFS